MPVLNQRPPFGLILQIIMRRERIRGRLRHAIRQPASQASTLLLTPCGPGDLRCLVGKPPMSTMLPSPHEIA